MSERFRILHCLRAPVGGLFRHVLDLAIAQSDRGHDVGLIVDSTTADTLTEARLAAAAPRLALGVARVPMSRLPGLGDAAAAYRVRNLARSLEADVLHGHGAKGGAYARLAGRLARRGRRIATFYTPHGGSLHYAPGTPQALLYIGIEKGLARLTDGLIFECDFIRRRYEERVGRGLAPTRVVRNALRPEDFIDRAPQPDAADFLFVGELRHLKGVDVLLRAAALVARARPVRILIVGSGPDGKALAGLAAELELQGVVTFAGTLPASEAFRRGRCLIVPSRAESLPYVVLEAAAAELPLIATDVGGIGEIVADTDTPLLPPGDAAVLARAMQGFLDAPQEARARARRLKEAVRERFAIGPAAAAVLDFYAQRLRARRAGR